MLETQFEATFFAGVMGCERNGRLAKDLTNSDWNLVKDLVGNMELAACVHCSTLQQPRDIDTSYQCIKTNSIINSCRCTKIHH